MRGIPGLSKEIYNRLKNNKSGNNTIVNEQNNHNINFGSGGAFNSLRNRDVNLNGFNVFEGGAAASLRNRNKVNNEGVSIIDKKIKDLSIDRLNYYFDMIKDFDETNNIKQVVRALFALYITDELKNYEIKGLNKDEIINVIEDFKNNVIDLLM